MAYDLENQIRIIMDEAYNLSELVNNIPHVKNRLAIQEQVLQYLNEKWQRKFSIEELEELGIIDMDLYPAFRSK